MGHKLTAVEVAIESSNNKKFQICHNCNGVEIEGDMELSNFQHAKNSDLSCVECEKNRLNNIKRRENKIERRKKKDIELSECVSKITEMENVFGIICTGFFEYKYVNQKQIEICEEHISDIGYNMVLHGDGATEVIVSKTPLPQIFIKTYRDLILDYDEISNRKGLNTNVDRFTDISPFMAKVLRLVTKVYN